ncbi:hypothetical protein H5410_031253 [Solanum commersonii]|uniref:Uncharacterized protein n=1 Tax=Solanum commersonii TaxID=4109 RepID=A0A9J5YGL4_SOLCO|nr:hypothetical protein H5410_031253 [Solanum commersonii]
MDEVQRWISSLLKPEERPTTRALKAEFISKELLTRYCKLIGHKYPDHICSKCNGEDNIIPDHDYKNAELRRSEDEKNPELKGDDGKLLKTHNRTSDNKKRYAK